MATCEAVCVCVYVHVCVCVRACIRAHVCVRVCVRAHTVYTCICIALCSVFDVFDVFDALHIYSCMYANRGSLALITSTPICAPTLGRKPHTCSWPNCPKRFARSDELGHHLAMHRRHLEKNHIY